MSDRLLITVNYFIKKTNRENFEDYSEFNRCLDTADTALESYIEMRDSVRYQKFHLHKEIEWSLEKRHPDRFVARYSMVMFHRISYAEVQKRGEVQAAILEHLSADTEQLEDVDISLADRLIMENWVLSQVCGTERCEDV